MLKLKISCLMINILAYEFLNYLSIAGYFDCDKHLSKKFFLYLKLVFLGIGNQKNVGLKSYEHKGLLFVARLLFRKPAQTYIPSFQLCIRIPTSLQPCQHRTVSLKSK